MERLVVTPDNYAFSSADHFLANMDAPKKDALKAYAGKADSSQIVGGIL